MSSFGLNEISPVAAGVLHHYVVQYPRQAPLFTTVLFFLVVNVAFAVSTWYHPAPGQSYGSSQALGLLWFSASYVNPSVGYISNPHSS